MSKTTDNKRRPTRHSPHVSELIALSTELKSKSRELFAQLDPAVLESDKFQLRLLEVKLEALISLLADKGTINRSKFNIEYYTSLNTYLENLLETKETM